MPFPKGYGYPLRRTDGLVLNHMIHNLTPTPTQVYMTYTIDFAPKGWKLSTSLISPSGACPTPPSGEASRARKSSFSRRTPSSKTGRPSTEAR